MRRAFAFLTCLLLLIAFPYNYASAHPDPKEHYEELEAVLFNNRRYSSSNITDDQRRNIQILEYASTICIDQFGQTSDQKLLDSLNKWGVRGIPRSVSEINPDASEIQLSPRNHRMFTHRGWDFVYPIDRAHWRIRKGILLAALNKVFGNGFGNSKQGKSFAAVIYYIHILGDYMEDVTDGDFKKYNGDSNGLKIPFVAAQPTATHDIPYEMKYHLGILFSGQSSSRKFLALISDIDELAERARAILSQDGGINSYERCMEIKPLVFELMEILTGEHNHFNYMYELLKNESFFRVLSPSK